MSSATIIEAFHRQVAVDPARSPLYLKCLKEIGQLRGGNDAAVIEQAVIKAYAEGRFTEDDVADAYKYFGLAHDNPRLTEDSIIGTFNAYLSSTTSAQEAESRRQMRIIGDSRRSDRIKSVADDSKILRARSRRFLIAANSCARRIDCGTGPGLFRCHQWNCRRLHNLLVHCQGRPPLIVASAFHGLMCFM